MPKNFTNKEIASLLRQVAAVYQVKDEDFFRHRAYINAAAALDNLTISAFLLYQQNKLTEIPGVGPNLAQHLSELFKTGQVKHFEAEFKKVPQGMFPLLQIRGIGPKTAYKIAQHLKLKDPKTALTKFKTALEKGQLKQLEGIQEKLQQRLKTSVKSRYVKKDRLLLSEALNIANAYLKYLNNYSQEIKAAQPLGSLRRHTATVGDIDIAISTNKPTKALKIALAYPEIAKVISSGPLVSRVKLKTGHEVDLKLGRVGEWGSLLQHYTGSKLHNIALRSLAKAQNLSLSEHGIKTKAQKTLTFKNEKNFYAHLGLSYIPPELREGEEEIQKAKKNQIPSLVDLKDIKGDLHIHSDFKFKTSHDLGNSPLKDILDQARKLNYQYIGLSDHNPKQKDLSFSQKKGIIESRKKTLLKQYQEYEKRVKTSIPKLLIGLEIDIKSDGSLALEDKLIDLLDYAIVSIHSSFSLSKQANTKRIIKALSHPKAIILGHPTGRKLNERDSIQADWDQIFAFCSKTQKILEINASPQRLDLPDDLIKQAIKHNLKFVINTDSHHQDQMNFMPFGVWTAKRGWAQKKHILNTLPFSKISQYVKL